MQSFNIIRENQADKNSFRVQSVIGMFDLQSEHIKEKFSGSIDLDDEWNVGVIVGASGTGKTTIARELFPDAIIENNEYNAKSVIDDMPKSKTVKEITQAFNSVGFSSPPSWLKPYFVLSNGEKMRVDLANGILSNQKKRPEISVKIYECGSDLWKMFRKYHYLNTDIRTGAKCYLMTVNDKMAGFLATIVFPHPVQSYRKVHRLVILPDYQGIGLGRIFLNLIGKHVKDYPLAITTSQPALVNSLKKDENWICTLHGRGSKFSDSGMKGMNKTASLKRVITTFVYKGGNA